MIHQESLSPQKTPKMRETISGDIGRNTNEDQSTALAEQRRFGMYNGSLLDSVPNPINDNLGATTSTRLTQAHQRLIGQ